MIKPLFVILLSLYSANAIAVNGVITDSIDNRQYGSLSDEKYRAITKLFLGTETMVNKPGQSTEFSYKGSACTGTFISPRHILTNSHCAVKCGNYCTAEFWNGEKLEEVNVTVTVMNAVEKSFDNTDWAILTAEKDVPFFAGMVSETTLGPISFGGFGALRIIKNEEIPELRELFDDETIKKNCASAEDYLDCVIVSVDKKLEESGKQPLFNDIDNFKISDCNINYLYSDSTVKTDCDASSGNSGGSYLRQNTVVGLHSSGLFPPMAGTIFLSSFNAGGGGLNTNSFYSQVQEIIKTQQPTVAQTPVNTTPDNNTLASTDLSGSETPNDHIADTEIPSNKDYINPTILEMLDGFDCD